MNMPLAYLTSIKCWLKYFVMPSYSDQLWHRIYWLFGYPTHDLIFCTVWMCFFNLCLRHLMPIRFAWPCTYLVSALVKNQRDTEHLVIPLTNVIVTYSYIIKSSTVLFSLVEMSMMIFQCPSSSENEEEAPRKKFFSLVYPYIQPTVVFPVGPAVGIVPRHHD